MEVIRKQINLDSCKSHRAGRLPHIDFETGKLILSGNNYGSFVCDLCHLTDKKYIIKYLDIISAYNFILEELRQAVYVKGFIKNKKLILRKLKKNNIISQENISIYDYTPLNASNFIMLNSETYESINEFEKIDDTYFILLNNFNEVESIEHHFLKQIYGSYDAYGYGVNSGTHPTIRGNFKFCKTVEELINIDFKINSLLKLIFFKTYEENQINSTKEVSYVLRPPSIEIPLLLDEDYYVDNMYYPYEMTYSGDTYSDIIIDGESYKGIVNGDTIIGIDNPLSVTQNNLNTQWVDFSDKKIEVESKLESLTHHSALYINDEIFGIPNTVKRKEEFSIESGNLVEIVRAEVDSGVFYECKFDSNGRWDKEKKELEIEEGTLLKCVDGEKLPAKTSDKEISYYNIPFESCLDFIQLDSGGIYCFKIKYINNEDAPVKIPFVTNESGNTKNMVNIISHKDNELTGDYIYEAKINQEKNKVTFSYVLGADIKDDEIVKNTGIVYEEILNYVKTSAKTIVDGFECVVWYENIDLDSNLKTIYNEEYGMYVDVRIAHIKGMVIGDVWRENIATSLPLFSKENSNSLYDNPKIDINLTFNRGNAAGWEKHFKLSECNTMRDLENYGNNYFNI